MNKFFKLVYVNLLDLFDINKIIIAREDGVKSSLEKRVILVALINGVYAYFFYVLLNKIVVTDKTLLLVIGFFISTLSHTRCPCQCRADHPQESAVGIR